MKQKINNKSTMESVQEEELKMEDMRCTLETMNSNHEYFISPIEQIQSADRNANHISRNSFPSLNKLNFEEGENEHYFVGGGVNIIKEDYMSERDDESFIKDERINKTKIIKNYKIDPDIISENNMPLQYNLDRNPLSSTDDLNIGKNLINFHLDKLLINCYNQNVSGFQYYLVIEKGNVKDLIGSHKVYEIQYFNENKEKKIKCYRRYDNFHKLNSKLRKRYPFYLIPKLTPKNPLAKIISPEEEFYENRRRQLNFYLNYLLNNECLNKTKEFLKFTSDAEFDEEYFLTNSTGMISSLVSSGGSSGGLNINYNLLSNSHNVSTDFQQTNQPDHSVSNIHINLTHNRTIADYHYFPESQKITETLANKIFGVFSNIFGSKDEIRKLNSEELQIRKMDIHYKGIVGKYREIKNNIVVYLRTLKINSEEYGQLANTCFYLKDTLESVYIAKENFEYFCTIYYDISGINKKHYENTGIDLENKFEVNIFTFYS